MVKKIVLVTGFLLLIWSSCLIAADEATAQNCPLDWHPPPCGIPKPPKAVSDADKAKARKLQIYYAGNAAFLQSLAAMGFLVGGPVGGAGPQIVAPVAAYKSWAWGLVYSDPWDPSFQEPYNNPWWPSVDELGLSYTDSYWLNELIGIAQQIIYYADFVYVSANRATSCQMAGVDCFNWQKQRVDWGLAQMREVERKSADFLWGAAQSAADEGSDSRLAEKLAEMGDVSYWWGYAE